jgi:hypothetical protein
MFDINTAPPGVSTLASMCRKAQFVAAMRILSVVGLAATFIGTRSLPVLYILIAGVALLVSLVCLSFSIRELDGYAEVPDEYCGNVLQACLATAEGRVYLQAVREQGRKFITAESRALEYWAQGAVTRDLHARLYDAPQ